MTAGLLLLWFNETILIAPGSHCAVYFCLSREISHSVLHMLHDADSFSICLQTPFKMNLLSIFRILMCNQKSVCRFVSRAKRDNRIVLVITISASHN